MGAVAPIDGLVGGGMTEKTMRWCGLFYRQPVTGRLFGCILDGDLVAIKLTAEPEGGWFRVSGTSKPQQRRPAKRGRNKEKVA